MRTPIRILLALLAAAVAGTALAGAELVLSDGQVLRGLVVERRDDVYALTLEDGNVLTLPVKLVGEVRLTGSEAGSGEAATGIRSGEPEQLAGERVEPPRSSEMLAAFRHPSRFRPGPINPVWVPTSDWDDSPTLNNWNPAKWYVAPIDPTWRPTPAFTMDSDVTFFNPARFAPNLVNPFWTPKDGLEERNELLQSFREPPPSP